MSTPPNEAGRWHLDKRVPIALIVVILMQTAGALSWAGAATQRLTQVERLTQAQSGWAERTARLEEQSHHLRSSLQRIEEKLDDLAKAQR